MGERASLRRPELVADRTSWIVRDWRRAGALLRLWRQRRKLSQLRLASDADVSPRHLSYVESGRSAPSRELIVRLADQLGIPGQARNQILVAAGFAPAYPADPAELGPVHTAARRVLLGHEPIPAIAVDRTWTLVDANNGFGLFTAGVAAHLLTPPVNVLRLTLHPEGLAPRIVNIREWERTLLRRLHRRIAALTDPRLTLLYRELCRYVPADSVAGADTDEPEDPLLPLRLRVGDSELAFYCTVTVFGSVLDVTVADLAIKAFYPMDEVTTRFLLDPRRDLG